LVGWEAVLLPYVCHSTEATTHVNNYFDLIKEDIQTPEYGDHANYIKDIHLSESHIFQGCVNRHLNRL
jgi:hypothetical protein